MPDKSVPLSKPIMGHNSRTFAAVALREPTAKEYFQLGDPQAWVRAAGDTVVLADNDAVIRDYVERCIVEPDAALVTAQVNLRDAIAIKAAVLSFFSDARSPAVPANGTDGKSLSTGESGKAANS